MLRATAVGAAAPRAVARDESRYMYRPCDGSYDGDLYIIGDGE